MNIIARIFGQKSVNYSQAMLDRKNAMVVTVPAENDEDQRWSLDIQQQLHPKGFRPRLAIHRVKFLDAARLLRQLVGKYEIVDKNIELVDPDNVAEEEFGGD